MSQDVSKTRVISHCVDELARKEGIDWQEAQHNFNEVIPKKKRLKMIKRARRAIKKYHGAKL